MAEKHIVLRSSRASTGDVFLGPMAGPLGDRASDATNAANADDP